jgi:chemotaxis protein methyltransferase CheR
MTETASRRPAALLPPLGYGDTVRFARLLLERCGLHFSESRQPELELGVRHAFAASTCTDLDSYYQLLRDPVGGALDMDRLVNAVTVSETHFFRDTAQFDALYNHVLPQVIERRRSLRTLRVWSAGCASGEEPYSIAMLLRELLPDVDQWAITILATDVNTESLDRARRAVYGEWAFREERAKQWRAHFFAPHGNRYQLVPQVRRMVTFARLNLAEPSYPAYETNTMLMDLILCRNVTIYFGEAVTCQVAERLYSALTDGGWLVVGHSEPSLTTYRRFQVRNFPGAVLYQRVTEPAAALPAPWPAVVAAPNPPAADTPAPLLVESDSPKGANPVGRAQELLEYGHSEQARDLLLEQVRRQPDDPPACALLGQAYANLGDWAEAESWCRQALRVDKLSIDAYYTLALVLQHEGLLGAAVETMKKVVYLDRNHVLGHYGLANLYRDSGQLPQARKSLDNARRLLEKRATGELIANSGGVTAGRLREAIVRQQQWDAERGERRWGGGDERSSVQ